MATCRCGVDIKWVKVSATGEKVPIELRADAPTGKDRYQIAEYGEEWVVDPMDPLDPAFGNIDHRVRCPR